MDAWKDGDTRELVTRLTECGERFGHTEQLRERMAAIIRPLADRLKLAERDSALLGELLAVIHKDGGHYQAEVGTVGAVDVAISAVILERANHDRNN